MTTTTSTTSATATPTPTPTAASVTASAAQSLLSSLDTGSGVDTASLVTSLVTAQFADKTQALTTRSDALTAQISGTATLKNAIATFSNALKSLSSGGTLTTQPVSSSSAITATALPGASLAGLSRSVTVEQLASAQSVTSAASLGQRSAALGAGTLKITLGTGTFGSDGSMTGFTANGATEGTDTFSLSFDAGATIDTVAKAINASKSGVTASVVTTADGSAFLSLRGATGQKQAFTLDGTGSLSSLTLNAQQTSVKVNSQAADARLNVDNVEVTRASNSISDLIDGVKLQLNATSAAPVSLTSETPTSGLSEAVNDFVDSYNQVLALVQQQIDPKTGPLRTDAAAQSLLRSMRTLTSTDVRPRGSTATLSTLAQVGVRTNRDGTLQVDAASLAKVLANDPADVEAMFAIPGTDSTAGLVGHLNTIANAASSAIYGLGASAANYTAQQSKISDQQTSLADKKTAATTRLTQQFSTMNSKVAAYKSTQTFLANQIKAWNKSDD